MSLCNQKLILPHKWVRTHNLINNIIILLAQLAHLMILKWVRILKVTKGKLSNHNNNFLMMTMKNLWMRVNKLQNIICKQLMKGLGQQQEINNQRITIITNSSNNRWHQVIMLWKEEPECKISKWMQKFMEGVSQFQDNPHPMFQSRRVILQVTDPLCKWELEDQVDKWWQENSN